MGCCPHCRCISGAISAAVCNRPFQCPVLASPSAAFTEVRQRQRPCCLYLAQRKAGVQVFHIGQVQQYIARKLRESVQITCHHLQLEGAGAADVVAGNHFGDFLDGFFHGAGHAASVAVGVQAHKGEHAQANFAPVEFGPVAQDKADFLQGPHAPPAGRGRQAHALRQLRIGQACFALQLAQDGYVEFVECVHKVAL